MFDWFRKKDRAPTSWVDTLLALPDDDFADLFARTVRHEIPAGHAMIVVAYANVVSWIGALWEQEGGKSLDVIEKMARQIFERLQKLESAPSQDAWLDALHRGLAAKDGEVGRRRLGWFFSPCYSTDLGRRHQPILH